MTVPSSSSLFPLIVILLISSLKVFGTARSIQDAKMQRMHVEICTLSHSLTCLNAKLFLHTNPYVYEQGSLAEPWKNLQDPDEQLLHESCL